MSDNIATTPLQNTQNVTAAVAADSAQNQLEGNNKKKVAEELLKESSSFSNDSKIKAEQAKTLQDEAATLEQAAKALRLKAEQKKRNEKVKEDNSVELAANVLEIVVPKDAPPEMLEELADRLETLAKNKRRKADDLLKQSEDSDRVAKQLKEHADMLSKKDMNSLTFQSKIAKAHSEGLNMVFKKLGIYRLDSEYKEQVAYTLKKESEDKTKGLV